MGRMVLPSSVCLKHIRWCKLYNRRPFYIVQVWSKVIKRKGVCFLVLQIQEYLLRAGSSSTTGFIKFRQQQGYFFKKSISNVNSSFLEVCGERKSSAVFSPGYCLKTPCISHGIPVRILFWPGHFIIFLQSTVRYHVPRALKITFGKAEVSRHGYCLTRCFLYLRGLFIVPAFTLKEQKESPCPNRQPFNNFFKTIQMLLSLQTAVWVIKCTGTVCIYNPAYYPLGPHIRRTLSKVILNLLTISNLSGWGVVT